MHHFHHLSEEAQAELFHLRPQDLSEASPREELSRALGAALYMPGTRPDLRGDLRKQFARGCTTLIVCLEDSISDLDLPLGEARVAELLKQLATEAESGSLPEERPLLFLRVRSPEHLRHMAEVLTAPQLQMLTGLALPKFGETFEQAEAYMEELSAVNKRLKRPLYCMPILESANIGHLESRRPDLFKLRELLLKHREEVLCVRIGATDLSSLFAVRRSPDLTVYDVPLIGSILSDIVNVFGRAEGGFVVSGSVWEHFIARERLSMPNLRKSPFAEVEEAKLRTELVMEQLDGFIREVLLDRANGILGKTVIHPTHVNLVNALSMVTFEEFTDAQAVLGLTGGGAVGSATGTKMNEGKPHYTWAQAIMLRAAAFGVLKDEVDLPQVLHALHRQELIGA